MSVSVLGPRSNRSRLWIAAENLGLIWAVCDAVGVLLSGLAAAVVYHGVVADGQFDLGVYMRTDLIIALFFVSVRASAGTYSGNTRRSRPLASCLSAWNLACFGALLIVFLLKQAEDLSRATLALTYVFGLFTVVAMHVVYERLVELGGRNGWLAGAHTLIVGTAERLQEFANSSEPHRTLVAIPGAALGNDAASRNLLADELRRAVDTARLMQIDVVRICVPWFLPNVIQTCASAFMALPVTLHLDAEKILDHFQHLEISNEDGLASLRLVKRPLRQSELFIKRVFDVCVASVALVLLAPLLALVAIAIKLDSAGPVFFRQRRYGFNQQTFSILKFRSMHVLDDGDVINQAVANDPRVTRVGRWLRRTSLDELPQLVNVLKGEMSVVGPRPHALAHNREYETKIALYARRHNVKPGITGWAQINGLRGRTESVEMMRRRLEHDLYYIDHWSLSFDIFIMACTTVSPRVFINAG